MAKIVLRVICLAQNQRHDITRRMESADMKQYTEQHLDVDQLDEVSLRSILDPFVERYVRVAHCREPRSWIQAGEDIEELKLRRAADIIGDSDKGSVYLEVGGLGRTGNERCFNCHWFGGGGTGFLESGKSVFFCNNADCRVAMNKYSSSRYTKEFEAHKAVGQCIFNDYVNYPGDSNGYCTNRADGGDHLCSKHREVKCAKCGEQALYMLWDFGSLANSSPRCNEHSSRW